YGSYVELAERINRLTPGGHPKKTAFFTTGAEALENAVKIARAATGRTGVVAFSGAFHGRTFMGMALTGKVAPYKQDFGPLPAEVYHIPFPSRLDGITVQDSLRALDLLFKADISPNRVAAIVIEPVQGEGGFNVAPPELLRALRERCDAHGILLIVDEVQTGFARTGPTAARPRVHAPPQPYPGAGHRHRAGPGRRRLHRRSARTPARAARALRRPWHPAHRRRSPDRFRPYRQDVRHRALERDPRPDHDGQEPGGRHAPVRRLRPCRTDGRRTARIPGRHLRGQSAGHRRRSGGAGRDRRRRAGCARRIPGPAPAPGTGRLCAPAH